MDKLYHIIKIVDYKGGELCSALNLTFNDFLEELPEVFGLWEFIEDAIDDEIIPEGDYEAQRELLRGPTLLKWVNNHNSLYGSGDRCWSLYETYNNHILELDLTQELLNKIVEVYIQHEYL